MDRRRFVTMIGGALAAPLVCAQQPAKVHRIGFLSAGSAPGPQRLFTDPLAGLGRVEGKNLVIEYRFAEGQVERLHALANDLVQRKVDLIVASATPAAQAAMKATSSIPVVFVAVVDPVGAGLVASLARPDRNATGVSLQSAELAGKRLELLREVVPALSSIAVIANPDNASNPLQRAELEAAAAKARVHVRFFESRNAEGIEKAFLAAARDKAGALIVLDDPILFRERERIAKLATRHRLPSIQGFRGGAEAGALFAYGTSQPEHFRRAADYVDRVLKGAKPAELPVEQPTRFELVINQKAAKAIGLAIPRSVLVRADEVIEW